MTIAWPARRDLVLAAPLVLLALQARTSRAGQRVRIRDLYGAGGSFSKLARRIAGTTVEIRGFMAPPLVADGDDFVLSKLPMAVSPFCDTTIDWPRLDPITADP